MGRIKNLLIKRTARALNKEEGNKFQVEFNNNKNILGSSMPSKRLRNRIAGYITRIRKNDQKRKLRKPETTQEYS